MPQATACAGKQTTQYLKVATTTQALGVKNLRGGHGTEIYYAYAFRELENDENQSTLLGKV